MEAPIINALIFLLAVINYAISADMIANGTYNTFWFVFDVLYALALGWWWFDR